MSRRWKMVITSIAKGLVIALRFILYTLLLLIGRVLLPIANMAIGVGILIFLFCALFRPEMTVPMWAGAGLATAATVVALFYDAALRLAAPAGAVIEREV